MRHGTDDSHDRRLAPSSPTAVTVAMGLAVVIALFAAGCSSSNRKSAPTPPTTSAVTAGTTSGTILATAPPTSTVATNSPPTTTLPVPTLGSATALTLYASFTNTEGFGAIKPSTVSLGGDPTGRVYGITWQTWGGAEAVGTGTGWRFRHIVGAGSPAPVSIIAFDLGTCGGEYMYRAVQWFSPQPGQQTPSLASALHLCVLENPPSGVEFFSPSRNINCQMDYGPPYTDKQVYCQSVSPPQSVTLSTVGTFETCIGTRCLGNPATNSITLGYGNDIVLGPFRCLSGTNGMTCTASGSGFRIARDGIVPVRQ
jgi:hypothetical protein